MRLVIWPNHRSLSLHRSLIRCVPDNTTGRKLYKLVQKLKKYGIPSRKYHVSLSRMSAGGGDQYGSFNMPMEEDGILKVIVDGEEKHARKVGKNDPVLPFWQSHGSRLWRRNFRLHL